MPTSKKKAVAPWMAPEDMPMTGEMPMMGSAMPLPPKPVISAKAMKPKAKKAKAKPKKKAAKKKGKK